MKWNTEWVDLQNIEHMIAECWRMSGRRLERYCKEMSRQQNLIFAGELGTKFLELISKSIENDISLDWSKLQRDVHLMQDLIQDGQAQHDVYWKSQYQALTANTSAYFSTEFGRVFTEQLAAKLELDISQEQRMLLHDIQKIQKICASCNWEDDEKAKIVLSGLLKNEKCYFSSWLGDIFLNGLQQRYGKEEAEEPELEMRPVQETKTVRKSLFKAKMVWTIFICISIGIIVFCLYMQPQRGQNRLDLQNVMSKISGGKDNGQGQKNLLNEANDARAGITLDQTEDMGFTEEEQQIENSSQESAWKNNFAGVGEQDSVDGQEDSLAEENGDGLDADTADTGMEDNREQTGLPDILPQYQSFHEKYPDLFAWLKIPGTGIDHPVMQSDDEQRGEKYFYLHRDYSGKKSGEGSLFVESKSRIFPQDKNTVIYGHNMSNGRNFGILEQFMDPDFFTEHPIVQYDTIYETGTYQVAAVVLTRILYQEEEGFRYYRFYNYNTEEEFQECVDFIKANQLYDTQTELQYGDQLLMLSTCEYSVPNGRLVVIARKAE